MRTVWVVTSLISSVGWLTVFPSCHIRSPLSQMLTTFNKAAARANSGVGRPDIESWRINFSPEFDELHLRAFLRFVGLNDGFLDGALTKLPWLLLRGDRWDVI